MLMSLFSGVQTKDADIPRREYILRFSDNISCKKRGQARPSSMTRCLLFLVQHLIYMSIV